MTDSMRQESDPVGDDDRGSVASGAHARAGTPSSRKAMLGVGALVVLACLVRVMFPNADPSTPNWIGYVVDEGRWNQSARSLALFGTIDDTAVSRLHLFLAPGYQAVNFVLFKAFGIDFWSARVFSVVAGIALVLVPVLVLRRYLTPTALAVGVVLLGFESNLLAASRLAFPEIPAALGTLLAFLVLVVGRKTRLLAFVAGALAAAAVAMKATTVLVIPVLPLIVLFSPYEGAWSARIGRALSFVVGFSIWIVGGLALALLLGLLSTEAVVYSGSRLLTYMSLVGPYNTVMRFFEAADLEARNLLLLGVWLGTWAWWFRDRRAPAGLCELYLATGAWAVWWLLTWSPSNYLPGRYVIHFVVPATIHVMAGVSLLRPGMSGAIAGALREATWTRRGAMLGWLVLPAAVVIAAMATGVLDRPGIDTTRLALRVGSIVVVAAALAFAVRMFGMRAGLVAWFLAFPLVAVVLWLALREFAGFARFWQLAADPGPAGALAFVVAAALLAAALVRGLPATTRDGALAAVTVFALAAVLLLQSAPALVAPTYTIREASLDLGRRLAAPREQVRSFSAESLFLANRVRYRTLQSTDRDYDALVIFEHGAQSHRFLTSGRAAALTRVATWPVAHHPRYRTEEAQFGPASVALFVRPR